MKTLASKVLTFFIIAAILITPIMAAAPTPVLAAGTNLIVNGDFATNSMTPWWSYGGVTFDASGGELDVTVPSGLTNPWDAGTGQDGIALVDGAEYRLEFTASASPNVSINVMVQNTSGSHTYIFQTVNLTSTATTFSYRFTADQDEAAGKLIFQVGNSTPYNGTIDNVSLMAIDELLTNGDFATNTMTPWWSYNSGTGVTFDASGGNLAVTVPSGLTDVWQAGTGHDNIQLVDGNEYRVEFTASASPNVSINVMVQNSSGGHTYIFQTVALTSTPTNFSYTFTADQDESAGKFIFQVGSSTPYSGIIDNVSLTGPVTTTPPPSEVPTHIGELLLNGTFSDDSAAPWWTNGATADVDQSRLEATITNGNANPWDAIVGQAAIPVFDTTGTPELEYTLTLKAWASANMTVTAIIQKDGPDYDQYFSQALALTTTPKVFTFQFDSASTDMTAVLQFQMGGQGNNVVYLDNLSLNGPEPVSHMASGTSLIINGDFSNGTNPWWNSGTISMDVSSGEAAATVSGNPANTWDAILGQNNISLLEGGAYTLDFDAWASTPVNVLTLIQLNASPFTSYFNSPLALTTTSQHFHFEFTAPATDSSAGFQFPLGSKGNFTFYVDNVMLLGPKPTPPTTFLTGVRVNQTGYLPDAPKIASVAIDVTTPQSWTLYNSSNTPVATGTTTIFGEDQASGEAVQHADFSNFTTPGTGYVLEVYGEQSHPFDIGANVYHSLQYDSLAYFYQTRAGIPIEMPYAGRADLEHPAGHIGVLPNLGDTNVPCFSGTDLDSHVWTGCSYTLDVSKGWYDAGDHGKYVVNGGIAVWTLLNQYERAKYLGRNEAVFADGELNIPENANGVPDILDEVRWEMEFMLSMQVPSGEVVEGQDLSGMAHHKVADEFWTGLGLSPDQDPVQRYLYPPTTAATLNLSATAAQCARIWAAIDAAFSASCLTAAETAWDAALAHPTMYAGNFNGSGGYGDNNVTDEFYWAASELFVTTGEQQYKDFMTASPYYLVIPAMAGTGGIVVNDSFGWPTTQALGNISLAIVPNTLPAADVHTIKDNVVAAADGYAANIPAQGYKLPYRSETGLYYWGSNSSVLNNMVVLALAYDFTAQAEYVDAISNGMDYLLGRNPNAKSYVSGYGENPMVNPHHRFWAPSISGFPVPPPGVVSGGPNSNMDDPYIQALFPSGCNDAPQKCYADHLETFSTNEVTINWNAPLAWITAFINDVVDTHTISGNAGAAGATLTYTDGTARTVIADSNGDYSLIVSNNWSGTVTPSKTGITFTPANRTYANVMADKPAENYTAAVTISGKVSAAGAKLHYNNGGPKTVTANAAGVYSISVPYNWSGTVTPSKAGLTFTPAVRTYSNVQTNFTNRNYAAILTVTSNGSQDGTIVESKSGRGVGGQLNSTANFLQLGDDGDNRERRAILSFDTALLPANAIIQSATLTIKQSGAPDGNPFSALGKLWADIRTGSFGAASLQPGDFRAAASATKVGYFNATPVDGWYTNILNVNGRNKLNDTGLTQFRLYFPGDNNNNDAEYMKFWSGNATNGKPTLKIVFTIP